MNKEENAIEIIENKEEKLNLEKQQKKAQLFLRPEDYNTCTTVDAPWDSPRFVSSRHDRYSNEDLMVDVALDRINSRPFVDENYSSRGRTLKK